MTKPRTPRRAETRAEWRGPRAWSAGALVALALLAAAANTHAQDGKPLHLVLTPSQKPTDLLAAGEEFGRVLGGLVGTPVRVTVA